jgi:hypothetical protein
MEHARSSPGTSVQYLQHIRQAPDIAEEKKVKRIL